MPLSPNIPHYPSYPLFPLLNRLAEVVDEIASLTQSYWQMQADETRTKGEAYLDSPEETVAAKQRDVELATYHLTASVLETRARLEALREERNLIILLINLPSRKGTDAQDIAQAAI